MSTTRTLLGTEEPEYELTEALDPDVAGVFADIPAADLAFRDRAREFVSTEILPVIDDYWNRAEYPVHLVKRLGDFDLLRDGIDIEGLPHQSALAAGLVLAEISRGDGSIGTIIAVQGALALRSIALLGNAAQKAEWLLPLATGEKLGAFGLTEPTHGSDSVSLETVARSIDSGSMDSGSVDSGSIDSGSVDSGSGGGYEITGHKKWIGNGSVGDVTVVWARGDDGKVHGYLVPQDTPGYSAEVITNKASLRAIWQASITLDAVRVPESARLAEANSFADTSRVLQATRLGVAWAALGHATACYETAVHYSRQRIQFGRPLAASQIVQERLARMLSELTSMQTLIVQLTRRDEAGALSGPAAALGKYSATRAARSIAANARDLLGGNGILLQNRVARHFADIESLHTYEGTETVQALLIGRDITGISAFAG